MIKDELKINISYNLKYFLKIRQKTRKMVCNDLDIKYTTFCDWINGKTTPKPKQLGVLADYLGISVGDFYIDLESQDTNETEDRLVAYYNNVKEFNMSVVKEMSDEQIRDLLKNGYRFKHKTLEERAQVYDGKLYLDGEIDWDVKPQGRECW